MTALVWVQSEVYGAERICTQNAEIKRPSELYTMEILSERTQDRN